MKKTSSSRPFRIDSGKKKKLGKTSLQVATTNTGASDLEANSGRQGRKRFL
jgi:hypothetical protein